MLARLRRRLHPNPIATLWPILVWFPLLKTGRLLRRARLRRVALARTRCRLPLVLAVALLLAVGIAVVLHARGKVERVGVFTTLPILWAEADSVSGLLNNDTPPHWAKAVLAARGEIVPLDSLLDVRRLHQIVMAQPRPLSPAENVALDGWVRGGGHLLLFADPMLTAQSSFSLGDKRRPQDVVLLSPILTRWGLSLQFDEDQPAGEHAADVLGAAMPVNLPGALIVDGKQRNCRVIGAGLAVTCRIGSGKVLVVADAAVLETGDEAGQSVRSAALVRLLGALN